MPIARSRRLGTRYFALLVTLLTGRRATDTTSGFCCLNRRAMELLGRHMPQDYPEVESRLILHKAGLTVVEVGVPMWARASGVSSITRWRSVYYAAKVTVAVLVTALKEFPRMPEEPAMRRSSAHHHTMKAVHGAGDFLQESAHVDSLRAAGHSYPLQRPLAAGDHSTDPPA
jgi:hypothetical protein